MDLISNHSMKVNEKTSFISLDPQLLSHISTAYMTTSLGGTFYCSWSFGLLGHVSQQQLLAEGLWS